MRIRKLRFLVSAGIVGALYLPSAVPTPMHAAGAKPFAGQTVNVQEAGYPPPASALAQFTAQTGIKVNWTNIGWDSLQTKITAAMVAHTYFADVTDVDWSRVGQFYKLKWFTPLNTYFDVPSLQKDVPQLGTFVAGSTLVGVPVDASFMVTTVNATDFKKAGITAMPKTLTEYTADLKKLQSSGVSPTPLDIPFSAAEGLSTYWYETTNAFGGSLLDSSFKPLFIDPKSPGYRALQWMVDAYKSGLVPKGNINIADAAGQASGMALNRVASVFSDYSGNIATLYDVPSSSKVVGQIQYINTPGVNGPAGNLSNQDGMGIPTTAKNPGAAAEFIKFYISTQNQANWYGLNGTKNGINGFTMPMRLSSLQLLLTAGKFPQGAQLMALLKQSKPVFANGTPPWYTQFSAKVNTNIHAAALGSESVDSAIKSIADTVNSLR
jgi:multiple sugar transport system substrate-binding protein